jgi:hypothetical protein
MKSNRERKNSQVARARQSCKEVTYSTRKKWAKSPKQGRKKDQPKKTKKPKKKKKKKQKKSRKKAEKSNLKRIRIRSSNVKFGARESNSAKAGSSQHVRAHNAHSQNAVSRLERQRAAGQNRAESPNCPGHSPQASYFLSFIYLFTRIVFNKTFSERKLPSACTIY